MSVDGSALSTVLSHGEGRGRTHPLSECVSEDFSPLESYDPVVVADNLEDYELMRSALPLRSLDWTPVVSVRGHPVYSAVCDVCGAHEPTLSHCGRPLCIPCQRKRVARRAPVVMDAVLLVLEELDALNREHNKSDRLRFVGLTLKNVPMGSLGVAVSRVQKAYRRLRRRRFWKDKTLGDIPRVEWTYCLREWGLRLPGADWSYCAEPTWHVHLHAITAGGFIPAGPKFARKGESNLRDEWFNLTGDSMIVKVESVENPQDAVSELVKYLFKPTDDAGDSIAEWPEDALREAAAVVAGPYRKGWYCQPHQSRLRSKCLERFWETPDGFRPVKCTGEYRLEWQGFRPLVPTGIFRRALRRAKARRAVRPSNCRSCGLGKVHGEAYWNARARESCHSDPWAGAALKSIQAHDLTSDYPRPRLNLLAEMPGGWIPPPPYERFRPELRAPVVEILRSESLDLDGVLDQMDSYFGDSMDCASVELAVESLRSLCIIYPDRGGRYHLNGSMLDRLTRGGA